MSEQRVWPSEALAADILGDVAAARAHVAGLAHTLAGDDLKPAQAALVAAVGRLDELAVSLQTRLGVPSVLREPFRELPAVPVREPGLNTAGRRLQGNGARHRARP